VTDGLQVAAVLVTHNSERFLGDTLASIDRQSRRPNLLVATDDHSGDATVKMLIDHGFTVATATSSATDTTTRVAQNFQQGLRHATGLGAEIVILGDHDDIWHGDRVRHQIELLAADPSIALLASDGFLIDEHGAAVPGTIRGTFPVPEDFSRWSRRQQWIYALRHSLATGGASALRPGALDDWSVSPAWLHDRWWSLAALRAERLAIDPTPVIDYRLSAEQQVGLDAAGQQSSRKWIHRRLSDLTRTGRRSRDLRRLASG